MNLRVFKVGNCPDIDKYTLKIFSKFMKHASKKLNVEDKPIRIRFLGKNPNEAITTGAYNPADKTITVIIEGRNPIDYFRTIAHEMTHQKQDYEGRVDKPVPEIGGDIEDEANAASGRIVKEFIKTQLTPEDKKHLGLGSY